MENDAYCGKPPKIRATANIIPAPIRCGLFAVDLIVTDQKAKEKMKLTKLIKLINGTLLTDSNPKDEEIAGAMGADLMSDVLASIQPEAVLLTGLCNPQVIRTAQIADIRAIVFVRGKNPPQGMIHLANDEQIPLITTHYGLFEACGILYAEGLPSYEIESQEA